MTLLRRLAQRARRTKPSALRSLSVPMYGAAWQPSRADASGDAEREDDPTHGSSAPTPRAHVTPVAKALPSLAKPAHAATPSLVSPQDAGEPAPVRAPARPLLPAPRMATGDDDESAPRWPLHDDADRSPSPAFEGGATQPSRAQPPSQSTRPGPRRDAARAARQEVQRITAPLETPASEPEIHIHIGRIEVRTPAPSADAAKRAAEPRRPRMTLDDYLLRRGGGG